MNNEIWEKLNKVNKLREIANREDEENKTEISKSNLVRQVEMRIKTAFIGALASFENVFGHLWGHNELKLTEKQEDWRREWQDVRKEILDKGNDQIKLARSDLNKYDVRATTVEIRR